MKLLLDENLSRRLVPLLQDVFPGTTQVALIGLERADDRTVWEAAKRDGYTVVTRDDDFLSLLSMLGYPPKIMLIAMGNCTNQQIVDALLSARAEIDAALMNGHVGLIEIY